MGKMNRKHQMKTFVWDYVIYNVMIEMKLNHICHIIIYPPKLVSTSIVTICRIETGDSTLDRLYWITSGKWANYSRHSWGCHILKWRFNGLSGTDMK